MNTATMFSSATSAWNTPADLVDEIVQFFGHIDLDPCPDVDCAIPARFHADNQNGLIIDWGQHKYIYCNPPYGRDIGKWTEQAIWAYEEAKSEVILLLPARTDTSWFSPLYRYTICFVRGRLKFSGCKNSAPFPSALVYLGKRNIDFAHAFQHRGAIVRCAID